MRQRVFSQIVETATLCRPTVLHKIEKLELFHDWSWSLTEDRWEESYILLKEYVSKNGNARPTDHPQLNGWVKRQRQVFKSGNLDQDKINKLQKLNGWIWDILDVYLNQLKDFFFLMQIKFHKNG